MNLSKRILFIFIMIFTSNAFAGKVSYEEEILIKKIIYINDYMCNYIDSVNRFVFDKGYNVYCDDYSNVYEIEYKGGRWFLTVK